LVSGAAVAAPPPVLAEAVIPDPAAFLDASAAYLDAVAQGGGAQYRNAKRLADSKGVDMSRPVWVLVFEPKQAPVPVIVVFHATDPQRVATAVQGSTFGLHALGELSVVTAHPLVGLVPDDVLTAMIARPLPPRLTVRADPARLLPMLRAQSALVPQDVRSVLGDADQLIAELDVSATDAEIALSLTGKRGSRIAQFGAALRPSDFRLATAVKGFPMVVAGNVDFATLLPVIEGAYPHPMGMPVLRKLVPLLTGEFAMGFDVRASSRIAFLLDSRNGTRALALLDDDAASEKGTFERVKGAIQDGSVVADEVKYTPAAQVNPGTLLLPFSITAAVGQALLVVSATASADARATFRDTLGAMRSNGVTFAPFADARARKESVAAMIDLRATVATGEAMTSAAPTLVGGVAGIRDGVRFRVRFPAALVSALLALRGRR
jgi:hypothetical protein